MKSILLVGLQFLFIFLLVAGSPLTGSSLLANIFFALSMFLLLWSFGAMQKSKFRIQPQPAEKAILIISGPYRYVRHPMYTSILLACIGLLIHHFTWIRLLFLAALTLVLLIKLTWEEEMLSQKFVDYPCYSKRTKKILPYLF